MLTSVVAPASFAARQDYVWNWGTSTRSGYRGVLGADIAELTQMTRFGSRAGYFAVMRSGVFGGRL